MYVCVVTPYARISLRLSYEPKQFRYGEVILVLKSIGFGKGIFGTKND
jgi:hypothetical protein